MDGGSGKRRILIVEDNHDSGISLQMLLSALGHEVRLVEDGETAVLECPGYRPDLILMDLGLPGISGYEAAQQIRAAHPPHPLTIAACTGWGYDSDRQLSVAAGIDHHYVKPLDFATLTSLLDAPPAAPR